MRAHARSAHAAASFRFPAQTARVAARACGSDHDSDYDSDFDSDFDSDHDSDYDSDYDSDFDWCPSLKVLWASQGVPTAPTK